MDLKEELPPLRCNLKFVQSAFKNFELLQAKPKLPLSASSVDVGGEPIKLESVFLQLDFNGNRLPRLVFKLYEFSPSEYRQSFLRRICNGGNYCFRGCKLTRIANNALLQVQGLTILS